MQSKEKSITLVGGGLVGSLLSIYLARRGYSVEIYERRPDMRVEKISAGRSINLAISERGLAALRTVGLEKEALDLAIPMHGRMVHSIKGELNFQRYGRDNLECINSISRGDLNKLLLSRAEETGAVKVHFQQRVTAVDLETKKIQVNEDASFPFETLIGTDGSASVVREEILENTKSTLSQTPLDYGYKELLIPAGTGGVFQLEKNALHIWPRNTFMLIALPNLDGSFTATLFLPHVGDQSFAKLQNESALLEFFKGQFQDFVPLVPDIAAQFFANPTGHMVTVKCSPWNYGGSALLLGDAAHAIVPFFGQGMNCGFEDCQVLDRLLADRGSESVFADFCKTRKPNADAIADLAVENFVEMRDKVADPKFLLQKSVEKKLQENFPKEYVPRYSLVSFTSVPYEVAYQIGSAQSEILELLCSGIKSAEEVDLSLARRLIQGKLSPYANYMDYKERKTWI